MSGVRNGIETMSAEDNALLDAMRDDGGDTFVDDAPQQAVADVPSASESPVDDDHDDDMGSDPDGSEERAEKPISAATKRVKQAIAKQKAAEEKARLAQEELRTSKAVIEERLRILTEAAKASIPPPAPPTPEPIPDVDTDPVGHFRAVAAQQARELADLKAIQTGFLEQQTQFQRAAEMRAWGQAQEAEFAAREPSYVEATNFLLAGRNAELEAIGVTDPQERQRIIATDITQIAAKARQDGANFAERVFNLATKRGFSKTPPAPVVPALDAETPLPDRAARVENGRANSTTIANAGAPPPRALSPERIANMSEHDFANYVAKIQGNGGRAALRELLGN